MAVGGCVQRNSFFSNVWTRFECLSTPKLTKSYSNDVGDHSFESSNPGHLKPTGPPRANGDERLCRTYSKMCNQRDDCRDDHSGNAVHKEEWEDRDERAYSR